MTTSFLQMETYELLFYVAMERPSFELFVFLENDKCHNFEYTSLV